jgi:hypothetical protein
MQRHFYTFICAKEEDLSRVQYNGFLDTSREPRYANQPVDTKFVVKGYDNRLSEAEQKIILRELRASNFTGLKFFGQKEQATKVRNMYLAALEESYDEYNQVIKIGAIGKVWGKRVISMEYERTKWIIREFQCHEEFTEDKAIPIEELSRAYENLQNYLVRHDYKYVHPAYDNQCDYNSKEVEKDGVSDTKGNGTRAGTGTRGRRTRSVDGAAQS